MVANLMEWIADSMCIRSLYVWKGMCEIISIEIDYVSFY